MAISSTGVSVAAALAVMGFASAAHATFIVFANPPAGGELKLFLDNQKGDGLQPWRIKAIQTGRLLDRRADSRAGGLGDDAGRRRPRRRSTPAHARPHRRRPRLRKAPPGRSRLANQVRRLGL